MADVSALPAAGRPVQSVGEGRNWAGGRAEQAQKGVGQ